MNGGRVAIGGQKLHPFTVCARPVLRIAFQLLVLDGAAAVVRVPRVLGHGGPQRGGLQPGLAMTGGSGRAIPGGSRAYPVANAVESP